MKNSTPDQKNAALLESKDTSAETQRGQILALLKRYPSINTNEFRLKFGIMSPAPRILELRRQGHNIKKVLETVTGKDDRKHHGVARYYLSNIPPANEPKKEDAA